MKRADSIIQFVATNPANWSMMTRLGFERSLEHYQVDYDGEGNEGPNNVYYKANVPVAWHNNQSNTGYMPN